MTTMTAIKRPDIQILSPTDCHAVLDRNNVGRLAYLRSGFINIQPIGYVTTGKWIFFRSAQGEKLEALARNPYVAFEVDRIGGPFEWESVVAQGTIYMLPGDGAPIEQRELAKAVTAMRGVMPLAFAPGDPTPERDHVYGLYIHHLSGRMARPVEDGGRR